MSSNIKGLDQWLNWADGVSKNVEREVKELISSTAYNIEADAKRLAPVDTGTLRRSIATDIQEEGWKAEVGTNLEYAALVEFGTSKTEAQPYMTPVFQKYKEHFSSDMMQTMKKGLS